MPRSTETVLERAKAVREGLPDGNVRRISLDRYYKGPEEKPSTETHNKLTKTETLTGASSDKLHFISRENRMTQKKVAPTVQTVEGNKPPSYEEANAGCPGYNCGEGTFSWDDVHIRRIFIRKVYSILVLQLLSTVAVITLFTFYAPVRMYVQTHPILYSMSNLLFLVTYISLVCCGDLRRQFPWNLILLTVFTLSMACMLGFISSFYNTKSVILCIGITALVCLCVTLFSFQSKIDITSYQGLLFILCMVMFFCAIVMGFVVPFGYVPWLHAVYASIGAVVFTMFLAFDTQLLMGSKQYTLSPEEYIFATLSLYLDIVYLFTFLMQLFGDGRE